MPARDKCEPQIVNALQKAGWSVRKYQYPIEMENGYMFADLLIQRRTDTVTRNLIILEVKCFASESDRYHDLYMAVGQYFVYRRALLFDEITAPLYLTMPHDVHANFLTESALQAAIEDAKMKLIIVNLEAEEIVQWID